MKDEEMAEEYAIKSYGNDAFTQTHMPHMIEPVRMYLKQGFLAGLRVSKSPWHDLRKDPNDLPEDTYDVLDQAGYKVHYDFSQNVWLNEKDEVDNHVTAWCRVPIFSEGKSMIEEEQNKELEEELLIKRKQLINAVGYLHKSLEVLTKLTEGMRHIAANHPTMQAHNKIMKNLRLAEDYEIELKNILSQGNFGRDEIEAELEAQWKTVSLKIINCIKSHLCKQDEDYDEPIISPKFLSDALDQMAFDGFEEDKRK